jgi:hypothetical protein
MDDANATSYVTAAASLTDGRLAAVSVSNVKTGSTADIPTLSSTGRTWVQVTTHVNVGGQCRTTIFRSLSGTGSGTITIDFAGNTQLACHWHVVEIDNPDDSGGSNGSAAVLQSAVDSVNASTTLTATFPSYGKATNYALGSFSHRANEATTSEGGWTQLVNTQGISPAHAFMGQWQLATDLTCNATYATSSAGSCVAIEVRTAGGSFLGPRRGARALLVR